MLDGQAFCRRCKPSISGRKHGVREWFDRIEGFCCSMTLRKTVDVCFVFDMTASMQWWLETVAEKMEEIVMDTIIGFLSLASSQDSLRN